MSSHPDILILFLDPISGDSLASTRNPRKCIIKSGGGAEQRRCWLELYDEDIHIHPALGTGLEVRINGICCFHGRLYERRLDSIDDVLSYFAMNDPEQEYALSIDGGFSNKTATEILDEILPSSGLHRTDFYVSSGTFQRLEFSGDSLFAVIDLLAKLAGNWYWTIDDQGGLSFHPESKIPSHTLAVRHGIDTVNLWETINDRSASIEIHGGVAGGSTYDQILEIPGGTHTSEYAHTRIYVRPIASLDAYTALRRAILQQMTSTHYEHYIDLEGTGESITPGDRIRFHASFLPLFPQTQIFRVKKREITHAHESITTRLYLTSGWESSPTYFHYFRNDRPLTRLYLSGQTGAFQLDISALDSVAHLDVDS